MKKHTLHVAAFALLILGLASCNKFDDQTNDNSGNSGTPSDTTSTTDPASQGEWIDLGLPSGLLWYSVNLGASSSSDVGDKYAWGETWTKNTYNESTYQYCSRNNTTGYYEYTKYNGQDGLTTLEPQDDAATVVLGGGARMPTKDEWQELLDNTRVDYISNVDGSGRKYTSMTNGESIFLPCTDASSYYGNDKGYYWSSSVYYTDRAWLMYFAYDQQNVTQGARPSGHPIRAVRSAQ